ncbi:chaperone NapD [Marilutibacter chinensis]|uniref:Chaperone NapD n=1 Tax=Marilutibacter chinensis TaxID=2912247 RepID=A0ABS9HYB7_9GAMM|nr:chaperone NapD [Lysobacter chinensis]
MTDVHIASLLVQHRPEAGAGVDACIAACKELELARRDGGRSIVLCESDASRVLMDRIDELQAVDGVLSVALVYHHVEPAEQLGEPIDIAAGPAPTAGPGAST